MVVIICHIFSSLCFQMHPLPNTNTCMSKQCNQYSKTVHFTVMNCRAVSKRLVVYEKLFYHVKSSLSLHIHTFLSFTVCNCCHTHEVSYFIIQIDDGVLNFGFFRKQLFQGSTMFLFATFPAVVEQRNLLIYLFVFFSSLTQEIHQNSDQQYQHR